MTLAELTKALSNLQVSEKQAFTAQQRIQALTIRVKQNNKIIEALQTKVEEAKKEKQLQEKVIKDLNNRMKGNATLLEARHLIWVDIKTEVRKCWDYLMLMNEKKVVVQSCKVKL